MERRNLHSHSVLSHALFILRFCHGMLRDMCVAERYVRALVREISRWTEVEAADGDRHDLLRRRHSVIAHREQLERILKAVTRGLTSRRDAEITLEINPGVRHRRSG